MIKQSIFYRLTAFATHSLPSLTIWNSPADIFGLVFSKRRNKHHKETDLSPLLVCFPKQII